MRKTISYFFFLVLLLLVLMGFLPNGALKGQSNVWATAYYAGWMQGYNNTGYLPAQNIDFTAVTHIIHFALVPRVDGTLDDASNSVTAFNANEVISRAHAAGKKVVICVGGWATDVAFRGATNSTNRAKFISNLVNLMTSRKYDGIDVDWEILSGSDASQYIAFITELRSALDAISPRPLLMAATAWQPSIFAQVKDKFDQINLMTYDLAGAWPGWVTWPNAPVYDGGFRFPSTGNPPPSSDGMVNSFIAAGVPASKIGIGIDFYGYVWTGGSGTPTGGATAPRQNWTSAPSVQSNVPYSTIMKNYFQPQYYRWDSQTESAYLSIDDPNSANDKFITYDDEIAVAKKVEYVRNKAIGGVIIWELGGGYRNDLPAGQRDLLLQALKQAIGGGTIVTAPAAPTLVSPANGSIAVASNIGLRWQRSAGASVYRVQLASDAGFASVIMDDASLTDTLKQVNGLSPSTKYYWRVSAANSGGTGAFSSVSSFTTGVSTDVDNVTGMPAEFSLSHNYPNPFNPLTTIEFTLPENGRVRLRVLNILGQEVALLLNGQQNAGVHQAVFDASALPSGTYFSILEFGGKQLTRRMLLLK